MLESIKKNQYNFWFCVQYVNYPRTLCSGVFYFYHRPQWFRLTAYNFVGKFVLHMGMCPPVSPSRQFLGRFVLHIPLPKNYSAGHQGFGLNSYYIFPCQKTIWALRFTGSKFRITYVDNLQIIKINLIEIIWWFG